MYFNCDACLQDVVIRTRDDEPTEVRINDEPSKVCFDCCGFLLSEEYNHVGGVAGDEAWRKIEAFDSCLGCGHPRGDHADGFNQCELEADSGTCSCGVFIEAVDVEVVTTRA